MVKWIESNHEKNIKWRKKYTQIFFLMMTKNRENLNVQRKKHEITPK